MKSKGLRQFIIDHTSVLLHSLRVENVFDNTIVHLGVPLAGTCYSIGTIYQHCNYSSVMEIAPLVRTCMYML